jgi:hypothetical protein
MAANQPGRWLRLSCWLRGHPLHARDSRSTSVLGQGDLLSCPCGTRWQGTIPVEAPFSWPAPPAAAPLGRVLAVKDDGTVLIDLELQPWDATLADGLEA